MNDRVKIALLLTGATLGFGSGFASLAWHAEHGWHHGRRHHDHACDHGRDRDRDPDRDRERDDEP